MFLSTRLWWQGQWPGYQHPLRAAWRKTHKSGDPRRNAATASCFGLITFLLLPLGTIGLFSAEAHEMRVPDFYLMSMAIAVSTVMGLTTFVGILKGDQQNQTFTQAIAEINRVLGIYVTKDLPGLHHSADIKLCKLAGSVIRSEAAIADRPHKDELHEERRKAREEFASTHKLFLGLGLAEESWDTYFRRQR
ncbi:MAG: hypothetical protein Q7S16_03030 [bacterium]|nr:hypothetical protein [bacterium]